MLQFFALEKYKEITIDPVLKLRYAVTNYGRLISFTDDPKNGRIVKGKVTGGYRVFQYKYKVEDKLKNKTIFICKLVANAFLEKTSEEQIFVLHLDHRKGNDFIKNLKWATKAEMLAHAKTSPLVIEAKAKLIEHNIKSNGTKLTESQVMLLKKKLLSPDRKTRLKMIAKQFGVSEMTLHRIKTGENWGHIKV